MARFDAARLPARWPQRHRATHTMLVPVQYQRLHGAARFRPPRPVGVPASSSAPARPSPARAEGRRADALAGRPGRVLRHDRRRRHLHPARPTSTRTSCTPSAGRPTGHDIRLIDEDGREVARRRGRRGRRPLAGHDDRLPRPARARRARPSGSRPTAGASSAPATSAASTPTAS